MTWNSWRRHLMVGLAGLWLLLASAAQAITLSSEQPALWLVGADAVWVGDPSASADVAYQALRQSSISRPPPFSTEALWFSYRLDANATSQAPIRVLVSNENPVVPQKDLYLLSAEGRFLKHLPLGSLTTVTNDRFLQHQQGQLILAPGESYQLLVRLAGSTPLTVALRLVSESDISQYNQQRHARYWVMLAVAVAMFLFNAVLLMGRRDAAYGWFMAFHGVVIFYFAGLTGYGYLFMPAAMVQWIAEQILTFNFILLLLLFRFSTTFLAQKESANITLPRGWPGGLEVMLLLAALLSLVVDDATLFLPYALLQLFTFGSICWLCWRHLQTGYTPARYLLASILIQILGGSLATAAYMGLLAPSIMILNAFFISTVIELLLMSFAVTVRMRFMEEQQQALLLRDSETALPNRLYLDQVLEPQWLKFQHDLKKPALLMLELSGFRSALQLMGPGLAQRLWIEAVHTWNQRLLDKPWVVPLPETDNKAAVLVWSRNTLLVFANTHNLAHIEEQLADLKSVSLDFEEQNHEIEARLAVYPLLRDNKNLDEVLRKLSVALVTGRQRRRFIQPYQPDQDAYFNRQNQLLRALHGAIRLGELECYIQPILELRTRQLLGGEILLRWHHADFGWVSPDEFIPLAEQMDWMSEITGFVLSEVSRWQQGNNRGLPLSVNLSVLDLEVNGDRPDLVHTINRLGLDPGLLKFEVTETLLMKEPEDCVKSLNRLRKVGCQVSIDDFGTGYSSLAYLSRIQPDEVKIDRAFIQALTASAVDRGIVTAIVQLARGMGAMVVAEGVEDDACLKDCIHLGIDRAQGFGIARPMPLADFEAWVQDYQDQLSSSNVLERPGSES